MDAVCQKKGALATCTPTLQIRLVVGRVPEPSPGLTLRTASPTDFAAPGSARGPPGSGALPAKSQNPTLAAPRMAEFGAGGAGLRDEDRRALKEGKKLLKKALGAAGVLKGGKHKEKLRREKERRRDEQRARAQAEAREMAARRAELYQRAVAEAAERRRQAESQSRAEDRDALEAERAAARARAQREAETERRCQATERALDGAQRKEQALREQLRTKEWDLAEAERERARWHADSEQARSTAEAQRSRAQFYVTEAQRRDASGDNENHRARYLEAELERVKRERDLERERASLQARLTETQLRFAEAELGRTRDAQQNEHAARSAAAASAQESAAAAASAQESATSEAETRGAHFWQEFREGQLGRARARQWNSDDRFRRRRGEWKCDECGVWSDREATACMSCLTPRPGAAPPPSEPFYGLHTFSVGTSSAPKREKKAGRRTLKGKRPPRIN